MYTGKLSTTSAELFFSQFLLYALLDVPHSRCCSRAFFPFMARFSRCSKGLRKNAFASLEANENPYPRTSSGSSSKTEPDKLF